MGLNVMKKATKLLLFLLFVGISWQTYSQSVSSTYTSGNIPLGDLFYDNTCNGPVTPLVVALPAGTWKVDSVSVDYNITADSALNAYMSEQVSQIGCQETGLNEGTYVTGIGGSSGTYSYSRTGLTIANGIHIGNLTFEMQAYRTWSGVTGCNSQVQYVDNSSWTVTVFYSTPPSCFAPNNLSAVTNFSTSAQLSWVELGIASNWEVEYDTSGFTLGQGNTINTSSNPLTLNGLTPNTTYDFYVRSVCSPGDSSSWVGPYTFTTQCNIAAMPYSQDFDVWPLTCWDVSDRKSVV